jgi:subtilisin family serine protease
VLSNQGSGIDRNILAGIQWAMDDGCDIISMSLGGMVLPDEPFSAAFEFAVQTVVEQGTLIVAAAGNDSARPGSVLPVSHPANCPSILAVAAIDGSLGVASFSNGGVNPDGAVDIAAPGVDVLSTWPQPTLYRRINGTSMATPHVAGIAALLAEANPTTRGRALGDLLMQTARNIGLPPAAGGAGLVQAP